MSLKIKIFHEMAAYWIIVGYLTLVFAAFTQYRRFILAVHPWANLEKVPLDWNEVYYTNCPLVSASNVDEAMGWTREEFKKMGVKYAYFRSVRENDWYSRYIHNLDNLIGVGGLFPPVHVHADLRRTRLTTGHKKGPEI
jgi:hypothetical protein